MILFLSSLIKPCFSENHYLHFRDLRDLPLQQAIAFLQLFWELASGLAGSAAG